MGFWFRTALAVCVWIQAITPAFAAAPAAPSSTVIDKQLHAAARQTAAAVRQFRAVAAVQSTRIPGSGWQEPVIAGAPGWIQQGESCDALPDALIEELAAKSATKSVSAELIRAVIREESAGRPCAVSPKGALGLMQLMPPTATELGVEDAFDAEQNVRAGTRYLGDLLMRYDGDLRLALAAYNAGPLRVDADRKVPTITETQRYVRRILERLGLDDEP
jgi:soluble lytic murein transglycosylase-like protein